MIKFFRKIRQNLISKNKIGKYLLYAFGEIILVIIGILIALNLNKQSEKKQAEAKVDNIFEDVLKELKGDINQSTEIMYNYRRRDSLASLVLNTELTYEDYADENSTTLWRVATSWNNYDTSNRAYNLLMEYVDVIPNKYDEALSTLDTLHNRVNTLVEIYNDKVWELVIKNLDDFEENYSWYQESDFKNNKEAIDYRLNNYKYKNKVKRYRGEAIYTHRTYIQLYRLYAIKAYKNIAMNLNKSTDSLDFIVDNKLLEKYIGNYINKSDSDIKIELFFKNYILNVRKNNQRDTPIFSLSSDKVFFSRLNGFIRFNENEDTEIITMTTFKGHEATTYTKVKSLYE